MHFLQFLHLFFLPTLNLKLPHHTEKVYSAAEILQNPHVLLLESLLNSYPWFSVPGRTGQPGQPVYKFPKILPSLSLGIMVAPRDISLESLPSSWGLSSTNVLQRMEVVFHSHHGKDSITLQSLHFTLLFLLFQSFRNRPLAGPKFPWGVFSPSSLKKVPI